MSKAQNQKTIPRQTNKDRPRRYRLSPSSLSSLRAAARKNKPWRFSTGPRTAAGKIKSKLNALKHGERSARTMAARRELNRMLRAMTLAHTGECETIEGLLEGSLAAEWPTQLAEEIRLSTDLMLSLHRSMQ